MREITAIIIALFVLLTPTVNAEPKLLPEQLLNDGWISLFDGETLFGWQPTGEAKWEVVGGEIRTSGDKPGFLMTTTRWADYTLYGEFRARESTNSGVFVRTALRPKDPATDCYEWNIAPDDNPFPTGSFVKRAKAKGGSGGHVDPNSWRSFKITAHRNYLVAAWSKSADKWEPYGTADLIDSKPIKIGHIGLQSNQGPVAFRNLMLLPNELEEIFDGKDLKGWNQDRAEKSKFDVTKDGALHLTNGPGQIETQRDFTNFVLQLDCKVNGDGLNSGVFFRTLRTGRWAGYESQIQNSFKDGDRTKPKDYGTGAIYRRQPARYVVPNDHEWFTKTIVADGPHMAVWVNGYQVSDWTDKRPEKENAREGKRLGGGAIALQGHDATTDFLFRTIRAAELPR